MLHLLAQADADQNVRLMSPGMHACMQDVVYGAANMKAMSFIGGGAQNFSQFFDFLGTVKDKRVPPAGSPFQMNFPGEAATPASMRPANESVTACWAPALKCSCGDCPDGPQCAPVRRLIWLFCPPGCQTWLSCLISRQTHGTERD
jgi:hypothetical protein